MARLGMAVLAAAAAALALGASSGSAAGQPGRQVLFNGKNLDGWYTFLDGVGKNQDPQGVFKVEDGVIHVSGQTFGYLSTEREYENYRLSVDFKWGQKKWPPRENAVRDAGLLYHVVGPDLVWANSYELQIQEGDTGDMWLITGGTEAPSLFVLGKKLGGGKDYQRAVKFADHEKPHGEWNTVTVVARGNRVEHWVNGKVNMVGTNLSRTRGKINLQSEGAEVFYRNIVLEPLD
ncbi:MAG: DUF1080 domain-containing protein [Armatimonadota bacterium]